MKNRIVHFFDPGLASLTQQHIEISSWYQFVYSLNDLVAGLLFVIGSILFFWESTKVTATWLFVVGSILFTLRPAIDVAKNIHLRRLD